MWRKWSESHENKQRSGKKAIGLGKIRVLLSTKVTQRAQDATRVEMQYMASAIIDSKIYNAVMYAVIVEQPNFQKTSDITYIPVANTLTVMMNHGYAGFDYDETKADREKLDARLREFYEDKSYVINTDFPTDQSNVTYDDKKEEANTNGAGDVGNSGYGGVE